VVKLNVANYSEGSTVESSVVMPAEVGLADYEEFCNPIEIVLNINKIGSEIYIRAVVSTTAKLFCDRCLDEYEWPVKETIDIICTTDTGLAKNDQDDVYFMTKATKEIDITESIRQLLIICLPERKLCKKNCKGMCSQCGTNLNLETCQCTNEKIDPRWEALNKLKFN
jgi:uncharacterized protein